MRLLTNLSTIFVPQLLSQEQKELHVAAAGNLLQTRNNYFDFQKKKIITEAMAQEQKLNLPSKCPVSPYPKTEWRIRTMPRQ